MKLEKSQNQILFIPIQDSATHSSNILYKTKRKELPCIEPHVLITPRRSRPYQPNRHPQESDRPLPSRRATRSSCAVDLLGLGLGGWIRLIRAVDPFHKILDGDSDRLHDEKRHGGVLGRLDACRDIDKRVDCPGQGKRDEDAHISCGDRAFRQAENVIG